MKITNKYNLPEEIAKALSTQWYSGDPKKVSVTRLIDSPRMFYLMVRHWDEIEEDVTDRVWTLFGSAMHEVLQKTELKDYLKEERLEFTKNGITVSGAFDIYGNKTISDYKVTSVWTVMFNSNNDKWEKQLNLYAYLLRQNGFEPEKAQIIVILRDWSNKQAMSRPDYPQAPIQILPMRLWEMPKLEQYVDERTRLFAQTANLSDNDLPLCSEDERWQSEDVWAVMKEGRKSAVKLFNDEAEAEALANSNKKYYVEFRPGISRRCEEYCSVRKFCNQYKEMKEGL